MKIHTKTQEPGIRSVALEGDVDFHSSPDLKRELGKLLEAGVQKLCINLEKVRYIDSSGLATFIELYQKLKRSGGKLVLFNLTQGVRSVFEIAKLDSIFSLAKNEEEAFSLVS